MPPITLCYTAKYEAFAIVTKTIVQQCVLGVRRCVYYSHSEEVTSYDHKPVTHLKVTCESNFSLR